jgi:APA family basic amino acid/polyamine antiporter
VPGEGAGREPARVGTFTAACVLVSNAVGSGIFTTTGFLARDLGDPLWILCLWAVGGALALAGAVSYAELAAALPRSGGEYVYLRRAFGPLAGFLSGWTSFTTGFGAAIAAGAASFGAFAAELLGDTPASGWLGASLVWALTAVHARGVGPGGRLQRALTAAKVGGIGLLVVGGLGFGEGAFENLVAAGTTPPRSSALATGLVFVLFAFSGWNAAAYVAGEMRAPAREVPRALVTGTLVVTALYLALNVTYLYALPVEELAREPVLPVAAKAAAALFGPAAARLVDAALCVSIAGAVSAMIFAGPRVYDAMARDGALPRALAPASVDGAPVRSLLLQSAFATALLATGSFESLVVFGGITLALSNALAVAAVLWLRAREPALARPYRATGYPWTPLAFVLAALLAVGHAAAERPIEVGWALATVAAGVPLYLLGRTR